MWNFLKGFVFPPSRREREQVDMAVTEMEALLKPMKQYRSGVANEVWPGLYIGDMKVARKYSELQRSGFTHVVNCVDGVVDVKIYTKRGMKYMGFRSLDIDTFDLSPYFSPAAEFIHTALGEKGKVLVHCHAGVSRSATIVLAYLMLKRNMHLVEAINTVKKKRCIYPNRGFIRQLVYLQKDLHGWI
ncbi:dual specificity phosphatase 29-like [Triplophysa rosa]|uniref:dual specificity phosphatase 29-like n=1 Tax=Triplophysa rosa TaxID=992332 RepID=UPI0025463384|nr:dual specificity phosphatase 29-like [Triplophysa rosa]